MALDEEFKSLLLNDLEEYELFEKEQRKYLLDLYGPATDLYLGDEYDIGEYVQNVWEKDSNGDAVWLGLLVNRKLRKPDNMSLVYDPRLLDLINFHDGWYPFAVKLQNAISNGLIISDAEEDISSYDPRIEYNMHWLSNGGDRDNPSVVVADTYIFMPDERGLKYPDVLRSWEMDSIPDQVIISNRVVPMRKDCQRRVNDEAPMFLFCDAVKYATDRLPFEDAAVRRWLDFFIGSRDYFRFDGKTIHTNRTLLAHKRFEVTVSYIRSLLKFSELDIEGREALLEGTLHVMKDPIFNSFSLRSPFGDLNQHVFARQNARSVTWSLIDVRSTNYKAKESNTPSTGERHNLIDEAGFTEAIQSLKDKGLDKNAKILSEAPRYEINALNMLKGKVNRMILALCGYTGTHSITAMIKQFNGTKEMGDDVDPDFIKYVKDNMRVTITKSYEKHGVIKNDEVADVVFRGGTSSASSTNNYYSVPVVVRYETDFLNDDNVDGDKVMKRNANQNNGKYLVSTKISPRLRSKNAVIISHPLDFLTYDDSVFNEIINAGSRLVRGTRAKRIITPNFGPIYANSLTTVLPAVRELSSRMANRYVNTLEGSVGTTYTGALPHHVMAPFMATTTNDPSYFCLAVDFGQFDSSQYGQISKAHADGLLAVRETLVSNTYEDSKDIRDLRRTSLHEKLRVQAESYSRPLFYKSNNVVAAADGVKSGELTTQLRNTVTNQAHTAMTLLRYNNMDNRNIELISENIIGDDKVMVLRMIDGLPYDNEVGKKLIEVATEVALENHMQLSPKRTVCGNNIVEHIKIFVAGGYIMQDVFLDSVTSEKNTFRGMSYIERLTTIYDIYMTMLIRFAQCEPLMRMFKRDIIIMDGIKSGNYTFIPTVKMLAAVGGPEMSFRAPEIRGMGRFFHVYDHARYEVINKLYATMKSRKGTEKFLRTVMAEIGKRKMVSDVWLQHFKRKNDFDLEAYAHLNKGLVSELIPEQCEKKLIRMLGSTVKEPVIGIMNDNAVMMQVFSKGNAGRRLNPPLEQKFLYIPWFIHELPASGVTSPYLASDRGVRCVHKIIGLAESNATIQDPVEPMNRLLRLRPKTHPSYISGSDVLSVLSEFDQTNWRDVLRAMDFNDSIGSEVMTLAERTIHNYIRDKDLYAGSIFDNTSRTYDTSINALTSRVTLPDTVRGNVARLGLMYEGYKVVLFMARHGRSVGVDRVRRDNSYDSKS